MDSSARPPKLGKTQDELLANDHETDRGEDRDRDRDRPLHEVLHSRPRRVMISGYYGFENLGDDLILQVLVDVLKQHHTQITVLSETPGQTEIRYDVQSIHRMNFVDIVDQLSRADLFISGGGGLLQDATGLGSVGYYAGLLQLAQSFAVPTACWAQGIGPLRGWFSRWFAARALERSELVTVRDEASAYLVDDLTGKEPEITADPVWHVQLPEGASVIKNTNTWKIGLSLRPWSSFSPDRIKTLARFLSRLIQGSDKPVQFLFFPFQPKSDDKVFRILERYLRQEIPLNKGFCHWVEPKHILHTIGECHVLFGMRFHSLVLGILAGVPVYGLVYDPKVRLLLQELHLQGTDVALLDGLDVESIREYFGHYEFPDIQDLKARAAQNFIRLGELLERQQRVEALL